MQRGSRKRRLPAKGGKARQRQRPPQSSTATAASAATAATAAAATSNAPRRRTWVEELHRVVTAEGFATWSNDGMVVSLSEVEWEYIVLPSTELSRNFHTFRHDLLNHGECRRPLQREERERERERAEEQKTAWYVCVCVCMCHGHAGRKAGKMGTRQGGGCEWDRVRWGGEGWR